MFDVMDAMTGSSYGHGYAQDTGYSAPAVVSAPSAGYDAHTTYSARSSGGYNNEEEEVRNFFPGTYGRFDTYRDVLDALCCGVCVTFSICSTQIMKVKKIFVLSTGHLAPIATIAPQVYVFYRLAVEDNHIWFPALTDFFLVH